MGTIPQPEKRRFIRYQAKEKVFAALGEKFSRVGKVKDISVGGLAFEYVGEPESFNDLTRIDIFSTANGTHLRRIPCRKIYEQPITQGPDPAEDSETLNIKRCGVEFGSLSEGQVSQLKALIDRYGQRLADIY